MNYEIKVSEVKNNERNQGDSKSHLKGFANVTFGGSFKVTNIAILESNDGRIFVSMPRYKTNQKDENGKDIYKDLCNPITKEFRESLYSDIIVAFETRDVKKTDKNEITENDVILPSVSVSVAAYEREGSNMKALAKVVLDECFIINNITILEARSGNDFVAMPGYKSNQQDEQGKEVYKDICFPVTAEFREKMYGELLDCYGKMMAEDNGKVKSDIVQEKGQGYMNSQRDSCR